MTADHEIKFVTPTGVQSTADTVTLAFEADYSLAAITFGDIDLAVDNDGTPGDCSGSFGDFKSIAASADATNWGASVSVQTLTLTPKTSAAVGEIPAGSCVRILIGQNATGGVANDQIINPSTPVSHTVTLAGAFGDTGLAYTFNVDSDQVTVTATVVGGGGGGGGCPPTCPAPSIYNIRTLNVTETDADVLWDTDISSTSFVDFGTTIAYGSTATTVGTTFNHSAHLSSLTPGTLYHYRVRSTGGGAESVSGDNTFTTLDTTAPVISNVQALDITGTSARIAWDTDEDADSRVDYDTASGPPYGSNTTSGALTNAHSLTLTGLIPNAIYRYRVTSKDASNNSVTSVEFSFATLDTVPPTISGIFIDAITQSSARVNWTTDELANSTVSYGLTGAYGSTAQNGATVANHQVALAGLAAGTLYHYSVSSHDALGNGATSTDQTFTTLPDAVPPANVSNFSVTAGDRQNSLSWTNPGDPDFSGVRIKRSTSGYPPTPTSGTTVYDSNGVAAIDTGLINGTTYYYTAFAYDSSGNFASGALANGTPFDTTPSGPVSNFIVTAGASHDALTWTNPVDADFADVRIQRSTTGYPLTPTSGTNIYIGSAQSRIDAGLTNGTTYYYSIFARDTSGNYSSPAQASGTPNVPSPPVQVCGDMLCQPPENASSCAADCPAPPTPTVCGNGLCERGETPGNCRVDCPAPPAVTPPPAAPPTVLPIDRDQIQFLALSRRLLLHRDVSGFFRMLPGRTLSILIPAAILTRPIVSMSLNFGGGSYVFSGPQATDVTGYWSADVSTPTDIGAVSGTIIIIYEGAASETVPFDVMVEGLGRVFASKDGRKVPVDGAVVTMYRRINPWIVWDAPPYLQTNPTATAGDGAFAYMAPQGEYYISVSKDGYRAYESEPFNLTTEVVVPQIELIAIPPSLTEIIVPGASVTENIGNVANALGAQGAYITKIIRNEIIGDPRVKSAATNYVVPAAAAVAVVVVATAVQATSIISFIYLLLSQPLLLIGRRKRKEFGVVFNSLSKLAVDLAIVRLFRTNGKLVRTSATDKEGRYAFLVDPGEYRIEASKQGYIFPTQYLKDRKEDAQHIDLYHGETIRVGEKGAILTANIPMDPLDSVKTTRRLYWNEIGRKAQGTAAFSGVVLTLAAALIYRTPYMWVLTAVQLALFFLFHRLARPKRPKNWGIIYDEKTKKPIPFAIARIVETEYNKVLESRVTDVRGRYNFLVGNNKYVVTIEKPGYETKKTEEINLTGMKKGEGTIKLDIPLKEKKPD